MIIVSQDKETIINFDNVTEIAQENGEIGISNNLYTDDFQVIGIYETKQRAKEILQEIVKKYENSMWKIGKNTISFQDEFVYEMPKE